MLGCVSTGVEQEDLSKGLPRDTRDIADAADTPVLHNAFGQLVGKDRWLPRTTLGTFPIRLPSHLDPPTPVGIST